MGRPARPSDVDELREVLTDAWLAVAPRRLAKEHFPDVRGSDG